MNTFNYYYYHHYYYQQYLYRIFTYILHIFYNTAINQGPVLKLRTTRKLSKNLKRSNSGYKMRLKSI